MLRRSLKDPPPEEQPFPVRGYVIINLLFYVFLLLVFWTAYLVQRGEVAGMVPVLLGLAVLFSLVSVYDALFDRAIFSRHLAAKRRAEAAGEEPRSDSQAGTTPYVDTASGGGPRSSPPD